MKFYPRFRRLGPTAERCGQIEESAPGKVTGASAGGPRCEEGAASRCILMHDEFESIRHKADRAGPGQSDRSRELSIGDRDICTGKRFKIEANTLGESCSGHFRCRLPIRHSRLLPFRRFWARPACAQW